MEELVASMNVYPECGVSSSADSDTKKKVAVTGASGFIGRPVVKELISRGYQVHTIGRSPLPTSELAVASHVLDLSDRKEVSKLLKTERFEALIHLAWYVGKGCHSSDENLNWVKITLDLLRIFQEYGGKIFVGAGTVSEYQYEYGYLSESLTPTNSGTLYGESKNSVFKMATAYCARHGITFKWPRIFNLFGPGEKPARLMPSVINACLDGTDVMVSDCLKFQDYLYVEDIARGIVDVFESDVEGAVNICSDHPVQLRDIVCLIAEMCDYNGEIRWGAIPAAFDNEVVVGNNNKLKGLGWTQRYSLEEGLRETIRWWKSERKKTDVR